MHPPKACALGHMEERPCGHVLHSFRASPLIRLLVFGMVKGPQASPITPAPYFGLMPGSYGTAHELGAMPYPPTVVMVVCQLYIEPWANKLTCAAKFGG